MRRDLKRGQEIIVNEMDENGNVLKTTKTLVNEDNEILKIVVADANGVVEEEAEFYDLGEYEARYYSNGRLTRIKSKSIVGVIDNYFDENGNQTRTIRHYGDKDVITEYNEGNIISVTEVPCKIDYSAQLPGDGYTEREILDKFTYDNVDDFWVDVTDKRNQIIRFTNDVYLDGGSETIFYDIISYVRGKYVVWAEAEGLSGEHAGVTVPSYDLDDIMVFDTIDEAKEYLN